MIHPQVVVVHAWGPDMARPHKDVAFIYLLKYISALGLIWRFVNRWICSNPAPLSRTMFYKQRMGGGTCDPPYPTAPKGQTMLRFTLDRPRWTELRVCWGGGWGGTAGLYLIRHLGGGGGYSAAPCFSCSNPISHTLYEIFSHRIEMPSNQRMEQHQDVLFYCLVGTAPITNTQTFSNLWFFYPRFPNTPLPSYKTFYTNIFYTIQKILCGQIFFSSEIIVPHYIFLTVPCVSTGVVLAIPSPWSPWPGGPHRPHRRQPALPCRSPSVAHKVFRRPDSPRNNCSVDSVPQILQIRGKYGFHYGCMCGRYFGTIDQR